LTYTFYDAAGRVVASSPGLSEPLPFVNVAGQERCGHLQTLGPDRRIGLAAKAPAGHTLVLAHGELDRRTIVGIFLDEASEVLAVFLSFALVSFGLVWVVGGWSLRPLAAATREAAAIGPANP
jgi:two-component system, OmpR family, sensor histidine kinase TctE